MDTHKELNQLVCSKLGCSGSKLGGKSSNWASKGTEKNVDAQRIGLLLLDLEEHVHNRVGVDVGIIDYRDQVGAFYIESTHDIVTSTPAGWLEEQSLKAPKHPQKSAHHKMRGVNEEDLTLALFFFFQQGFKLVV